MRRRFLRMTAVVACSLLLGASIALGGYGGADGAIFSDSILTASTLAPEPSLAQEIPPSPDARVEEVLAWAETARGRWTSIEVTGRAGAPGSMVPFGLNVSPETVTVSRWRFLSIRPATERLDST